MGSLTWVTRALSAHVANAGHSLPAEEAVQLETGAAAARCSPGLGEQEGASSS